MNPRSPFSHLAPKNPARPRQQTEKKNEPNSALGAIALQGDIAAIALDTVFQLFDFAALTGRLDIHTTANSASFYFKKGELTYGILQINHHKIGELLLESHLITEEQLQECLLLHKQGPSQQRFGQILLDKGYIEPGNLGESLLRQIKEAFFEALSWQEGAFLFYQNQSPPPEEVQLHARIDHLLLEGMVYLDDAASSMRQPRQNKKKH